MIPAVHYNAEAPFEFSEIDPVQNKEVDQAVRTNGFSEQTVWSAMPINPNTGLPGCGNPASSTYRTCYPPAVNYTPFYFLINGVPRSTRRIRDPRCSQLRLVYPVRLPRRSQRESLRPARFWCAW